MNRRAFLKFLGIGVIGAGSIGCDVPSAINQKTAQRPNILFIFSDDHACNAIGAYGSIINQTPNIDRIAQRGAVFENSFCANAICGPSRACVMSGKHSHANGFEVNWGKSFDGTQPTFMNILNQGGYQTALIGKWHLGDNPVEGYGIDHWELWHGGYYNPSFTSKNGTENLKGYSTDLIADKVVNWIEKRDANKPFLAMCTFNASHRTWAPNPKYYNKYKDKDIPVPETLYDDWENRTSALKKNHQSIAGDFYYKYDLKVNEEVPFATDRERKLGSREYNKLSDEGKKIYDEAYGPENRAFIEAAPTGKELVKWKYERYIKDYLRCVDSIDENVGRMLDYLTERGLLDNTIVIYSADQGFFLGEHGMYDKRWMFEESLKMPFIISWPGVIKPGTHYKQMIQNIDYAPTFIDAAGLDVPAEMQGQSMLPILKGENLKWRKSIYYHYYEGGGEHNAPRHEGVRTDRYKLINFYDDNEINLFDLKTDPHEMMDVSKDPKYATVLVRMKAELKRLKKKYQVPDVKSEN